MPIEIRELVIRAEFGSPEKENGAETTRETAGRDLEVLVEECVRQVLRILEQREER